MDFTPCKCFAVLCYKDIGFSLHCDDCAFRYDKSFGNIDAKRSTGKHSGPEDFRLIRKLYSNIECPGYRIEGFTDLQNFSMKCLSFIRVENYLCIFSELYIFD